MKRWLRISRYPYLARVLQEARPYTMRLLLALGLGSLAGLGPVMFAPAFELLMRDVINSPRHDLHVLWGIVAALLVVNTLSNLAGYGSSYLTAWSGQRLIADLRVRLFGRLLRLPAATFDRWRPGELIARFDNDLSLMTNAMSVALPQLIQIVVTFCAAVVGMLYTDAFLTMVLFLVVPIVNIVIVRFTALISAGTMHAQQRVAELTANLSEGLHAQRIIKAFRREEYEVDRFYENNERLFGPSMKLVQLSLTQIPVLNIIILITLLMIVIVSAHEVIVGHMNGNTVFRFWTLVVLTINPVTRMASYLGDLTRGLIGAQRTFELLDLPIEEQPVASQVYLPHIEGHIRFDHVRFTYPSQDQSVLSDLSLDIAPGMVVALIGPSGAGKTTIASLLPRFYDVTDGRILLDAVDTRDLSLAQLREAIGIVPQEPQLFYGTVAENIRYGRLEATNDEVLQAAQDANADEFIRELPQGYETVVGDRGTRLSGGQRQRIAIARALVRDPRILIFDEATSALDSHSERLIEQALDRVLRGRTTLIIAHRLSTIRRADRIIYLEGGHILEAGTHQELIDLGGRYAALCALQHTV